MSKSKISIDVDILNQLSLALKEKLPTANVGILSSTAGRTGSGPNNAEVGAAHEFGTATHPIRSFLRVPLELALDKRIDRSGVFTEALFKEVIATRSVVPWMQKIAAIAEGIVIDAFGSNGFGKWKPWKGNYSSATGDILVDTAQLERSITHEVVK